MEDQSIVPLTRANIRSVMNVVRHEIENSKDRDYNSGVKYIPSDVCLCHIWFIFASAFTRCFWQI